MKIVIAPDSYKGSLSAIDVSKVIAKAVKEVGDHKPILKPMADGGEGTLDAMLTAVDGERIPIRCLGALGEERDSHYAIIDGTTALIECATIAGLVQVPVEKRNPDYTTTYGLGQAIIDALDRGCTSIIIGLGGSSTNDGGLGMLQALGMEAWDHSDKSVGHFGKDLLSVSKVSLGRLDSRLNNVNIRVACDVENPLCGPTGASAIYGPQKGADSNQIEQYDKALKQYATLVKEVIGEDYQQHPGAGAAGGLGFAVLVIGGQLESGAQLLGEAIQLEESIKQADLVITGEGQSDEQTLYGKAPSYVAGLANKYKIPAILISGGLAGNVDELHKVFAGCFSIIDRPLTLDECMEKADQLLFNQAKRVIHLINSMQSRI